MSSTSPAAEAGRPAEDAAVVLSLSLRGMSRGGVPVLGALSLAVRRGETVAITGPSGIGKTTLLRIVAGLEPKLEGSLAVHGRLGFVFQEPTLLAWRTAEENLRLACDLTADAAEAALAEVGLGGLGGRYPGQLSLGQQRRLSLARAFAIAPDLLLMDEPFVSLDPQLAEEMMALFSTLRARRGTATLLVTHSAEEAERLASRILRLGGRPATIVGEARNGSA